MYIWKDLFNNNNKKSNGRIGKQKDLKYRESKYPIPISTIIFVIKLNVYVNG